jgi:transposase
MNAYSKDLRFKVLAAVDRGVPRAEAVEMFGVSLATLKRWLKRRREGGDLTPRFSTGRKRHILSTQEERRALWTQLEANDVATLERHCELWERRGAKVSVATMSRAVRKLGWSRKKDCEYCDHGAWRERLRGIDPRRLVFVDESSTNIALAPRYARAPRGQRAFGKVPRNWGKNVTLISSLSSEGIGPSLSIEGPSDGESFGLYLRELLCPTLKRRQIVVMDNLSPRIRAPG